MLGKSRAQEGERMHKDIRIGLIAIAAVLLFQLVFGVWLDVPVISQGADIIGLK